LMMHLHCSRFGVVLWLPPGNQLHDVR
jgi:hypothetical protein